MCQDDAGGDCVLMCFSGVRGNLVSSSGFQDLRPLLIGRLRGQGTKIAREGQSPHTQTHAPGVSRAQNAGRNSDSAGHFWGQNPQFSSTVLAEQIPPETAAPYCTDRRPVEYASFTRATNRRRGRVSRAKAVPPHILRRRARRVVPGATSRLIRNRPLCAPWAIAFK